MGAPFVRCRQRYRDWSGPGHLTWRREDTDGHAALEADRWSGWPRGGRPGIVVRNTRLQTTAVRVG